MYDVGYSDVVPSSDDLLAYSYRILDIDDGEQKYLDCVLACIEREH